MNLNVFHPFLTQPTQHMIKPLTLPPETFQPQGHGEHICRNTKKPL
jgi:hypothetical protein